MAKQSKQQRPHDDHTVSDDPKQANAAGADQGNARKDPDHWVTGDESMTGAQASYLQTLSEEAGEEFDPSLSKAEASKRIDALRERTGRGIDH
jgi:hypothetical protein